MSQMLMILDNKFIVIKADLDDCDINITSPVARDH